MSTEPNNTGAWRLCVVIPNGGGKLRVVSIGNKKGIDAAAKVARGNNPHLTYKVLKRAEALLGDLIEE